MELLREQGYKEVTKQNGRIVMSYMGNPCEDEFKDVILSLTPADRGIVADSRIIEHLLCGKTTLVVLNNAVAEKIRVFLIEKETGLIKGEACTSGYILFTVDTYEDLRAKHQDLRYFSELPDCSYGCYLSDVVRYDVPLSFHRTEYENSFISVDRSSIQEYEIKTIPVSVPTESEEKEKSSSCRAYIDGSFNQNTGVYGSGAILLDENSSIIGSYTSAGTRMKSMRNVAGEIAAAALAIREAEKLGYKEITLFHDYEGVGKWADHLWQAKNENTASYADYINRKRSEGFFIKFEWVKGHSGNEWNEKVDILAKKACGIEEPSINMDLKYDTSLSAEVAANQKGIHISCEEAIRKFYGKEKRTFKDYLLLQTGGMDSVSSLNTKDLETKVPQEAILQVYNALSNSISRVRALRWVYRGLFPEDAVRKIEVDNEMSAKKKG